MGKKGIRIKDIEHLKEVLKNSRFKIEAAFLFGSRAKGDFLEGSDWDIMIISDDFKGASYSLPEGSSDQASGNILLHKQ
jgi:predicted nucleotidyltransferase